MATKGGRSMYGGGAVSCTWVGMKVPKATPKHVVYGSALCSGMERWDADDKNGVACTVVVRPLYLARPSDIIPQPSVNSYGPAALSGTSFFLREDFVRGPR